MPEFARIAPEFWAAITATARRGVRAMRVEATVRRRDRTFPIGVTTTTLEVEPGGLPRVTAIFTDISDSKRLEELHLRAERLEAVAELSSSLAHEIKNPLAAIKTFVQLLPRKVDNEAFRDRFNVTVPRELDRVNGIVDNLLEVARTPRMTFGPVDLNDLLRRTLDLHRAQMEERTVQCDVRLAEGLPLARADAEHLLRAFSNLVLNALEAMPEGGRLTVTTRHTGANGHQSRTLEVGIADTGAGMDVETVGQLFNPFFTTKAKGTGLGLVLTHKIIEEHGGTIAVQSEPGMGTVFTLTLPEAQPG
jgi:signal transduction histidine kinase